MSNHTTDQTIHAESRAPAAAAGGRRVVASSPSYEAAERAVDALSDRKFPVEHVAIVGEGLKTVEQVTGRLSWASAALRGAAVGALTGLLIGWLFAVFDWFDPVVSRGWLIFDALWFGAVIGLLWGLLLYALTGGSRDFTSIGGIQADRYMVLVDDAYADEARRILATPQPETPPTAGSQAPTTPT
ncbi:general stress protein [Conexibacter woesei]|uniref:General stress protein 17M-like domain-containing protein n=1 Tax=Conexibacter woesei (strain DSM 14684 / CCUG 47730 / CIP 108061 / JCM 11494 / NBRC 100937 / ID131577) TaxID=469383 RepID=D3F9B2_CONWI|nr:general stress protein [Conexibacter woesei]ADB49079.1 hypothetical protein Cwoe_0644 [Conexibacter woesei DSM 14684]